LLAALKPDVLACLEIHVPGSLAHVARQEKSTKMPPSGSTPVYTICRMT
jgi:hypothetical protein